MAREAPNMVIDFFGQQDQARKNTRRLVVLFICAVVCIIVAIYFAAALIFLGVEAKAGTTGTFSAPLWNPALFLIVTVSTLAVVLLSSAWKTHSLSSGGEAVARMFNGRLVDSNTSDPDERKLLNVVEEMAIASGTPVPPVYIMDDEESINAFAAGYSPEDAVVAFTRGSLQRLSRDELQGVVAHEFSHILNGDMRMNIRLTGILFGILAISVAGYLIFRIVHPASYRRRSSRDKDGGGAVLAIMLFGLIIWVIGWIGVFFGRFIKAAVSRQREYLADAAAVQFTRYPAGIAGALRKIGGFSEGSRVKNAHTEETSHMFFGEAMRPAWFSLMATHPPLEERIRRLEAGKVPEGAPPAPSGAAFQTPGAAGFAGATPAAAPAAPKSVRPETMSNSVGAPQVEHIAYASELRNSLPGDLLDAARETYGARAIIFALLFDRFDDDVRQLQNDYLRNHAEADIYAETLRLLPAVFELGPEYRLPLADLTLPALRRMSSGQYARFHEQIESLVSMDEQVDLFEFALRHVLFTTLDAAVAGQHPRQQTDRSLAQCTDDAGVLLSYLALTGGGDDADAEAAFAAALQELGQVSARIAWQPPQEGIIARVDEALRELKRLTMPDRRRLIRACTASIARDGMVSLREAEVLRAVAAALQCPMPPLLAGRPLA